MLLANPSAEEANDDHIPENQREHWTGTKDEIWFTSLINSLLRMFVISVDAIHLTDTDEIDTQVKEMMALTKEIQSTGPETLRPIESKKRGTEKK